MTEFTYSNAPQRPEWRDIEGTPLQSANGYCASGGFFLAIRDKSGALLKEDFYLSKGGRRNALTRFLSRYETA